MSTGLWNTTGAGTRGRSRGIQRIINQYSFFSVVPSGIDCVDDFLREHTTNTVRFIIKKELRWDARDLLDQYNVNERMVYPGLDGLTKWLARHYYVKR